MAGVALAKTGDRIFISYVVLVVLATDRELTKFRMKGSWFFLLLI